MNYTNQSDRQGHSPCETAVIILVWKWQGKIKRGGLPRGGPRGATNIAPLKDCLSNCVAPTELRQPRCANRFGATI